MKQSSFPRLACALALAFLTSVIAVPLHARADDAPKAPVKTGKCMMWKVSSDTATVYLVGSIHVASPDMYPLPKEMEEAFAKSEILVVEVNMNKLDQAKTMQFVQEKGTYKGDETLSAHLTKESAKALDEFCAGMGIPPKAFDKFKPWFVSMAMEMVAIQKMGLDPKLGIDMHFLAAAEKDNKKIEELESSEFQLELLSGFDPALQVKSLVAAIEEIKDLKKDMGELKDAWVAGDGKLLSDLMNKSSKKHPELAIYETKIIDERNGPMAEKVEKYLKGKQTVFLVAGCAHMVGEKGILKILKDHHFEVEQSKATREQAEK